MSKLLKPLLLFLFCLVAGSLLILFTKGDKGNPVYYQAEKDTRVTGPFESSNTTARYALTEAIVNRGSFALNESEARFSSPDVVDYKGKFFSIFTPGVSFIGIPFYFTGKLLGIPQIITFFSTSIIAFINIFLIAALVKRLGGNLYAGLLSGAVFTFATNALGYSLTLTQHHASAMLLLLAILNAFEKRTLLNNILFGIIYGAGVLVDIPNGILMAPAGFYVAAKHFDLKSFQEKIRISFKSIAAAVILGLIPLIALFAYYNYETTGSYTLIGQSIGRSGAFSNDLAFRTDEQLEVSKSSLPFETRNILNGLYTLILSDERSWIFYSPILLIGVFGLIAAYKENKRKVMLRVLFSVVILNILIYSMFGDPWGGWAFGPRYLIPSAAVVASGLGLAVLRFKKNLIFVLIFSSMLVYSIYVSTLGALTTNAIPPKVEAQNLKPAVPHTPEYNTRLIKNGTSGNLLYNTMLAERIPLDIYWYTLTGGISGFILLIYLMQYLSKGEKNDK